LEDSKSKGFCQEEKGDKYKKNEKQAAGRLKLQIFDELGIILHYILFI
jgi:hypothetical protein